jgi:hypothetical protein
VSFVDDLDDGWGSEPTALEAAHYDDLLKRQADREERRRSEQSERAKTIFGECLLRLVKLGMREAHARSMLGKWRGQAKDDEFLVRIVKQAAEIGSPDPVAYVTKALAAQHARVADVTALTKGKWTYVGWEAPRRTPKGIRWVNGSRGKVWRDPYGKLKVLPPEEGTVVPGLDDEPGIEVKVVA